METAILTAEVGVAAISGAVVSTAISAEPLLTALISLGTSLVTLVGGELVKYLVSYLKKKREDIEKEGDKK